MTSKLTMQKKLAADIMKVGKSKVWISPDKDKQKDLQSAITRADIKKLISKGLIKALPTKVKMPRTKKEIKKRKGTGTRRGSKYARLTRKQKWMSTVRSLREMLKGLKDEKKLDNATYRKLYMLVKGGQFRSRSHLRIYLEQRGLLKKE